MTLEQRRGFTEVFGLFDRKNEGAQAALLANRATQALLQFAVVVPGVVSGFFRSSHDCGGACAVAVVPCVCLVARSLHTGRIDAKELGVILRALGQNPTPAEVQDIIAEVDSDGSGKMDLQEFLNMMAGSLRDTDHQEEVRQVFTMFDKDHNNQVWRGFGVRRVSV